MKFYKKCSRHHRKSLYKLCYPKSLLCMPICDAQSTSVSKIKHLVSGTEINTIIRVVRESGLPAYTSNVEEDVDSSGYPIHTTTYLQTDDLFEMKLPWLHKRVLKVVRRINKVNQWGLDLSRSSLSVRVAEYHEMRVGGALRNPEHYDIGSLVTVDIMLQEATQGAVFQTLETTIQDGAADSSNKYLKAHPFQAGDALVFVSHKYHCVSPLVEGSRKVLVIEFWSGKKRHCGHRCDVAFEDCTFVDC